jgi:hypothetical protein
MFSLESAIADWRKQMHTAGIQSPVALDELESHLREEIGQQMKFGQAERTAFEVAVAKMGLAGSLGPEFKRADGGAAALRRRLVSRIFCGLTTIYAIGLVILLIRRPLDVNERWLGFAAVGAMVASAFTAWQVLPRLFPVIVNKRVQSAIGLLGGISGMGWFFAFVFLILPRCEFTDGQLLVAVFWGLVPVVALPTVAFGILDRSENPAETI